MGSQTFEILRQGVWASLTGGWFYDPHQTVFCNVIHLYLWLFLLCGPFLTYLYFPTTTFTWTIYCILTICTISVLKILNMALHLLYDKAQTVTDSSFKNDSKNAKNALSEECGIEMKVIGNDVPSRISIEQPINEVSEANSMISLDHVTSTIDLKVDVHRKNSSESSESISAYSRNIYQGVQEKENFQRPTRLETSDLSQNQSADMIESTKLSKELSRRYSDNLQKKEKGFEIPSQLSVPIFKDYTHNSVLAKNNPLRNRQHSRNLSQGQEFIAEMWKNAELQSLPTSSCKTEHHSLYKKKSVYEPTFNKNESNNVQDIDASCIETGDIKLKSETIDLENFKYIKESPTENTQAKGKKFYADLIFGKSNEMSEQIEFNEISSPNGSSHEEFKEKDRLLEDSRILDAKPVDKSRKISEFQEYRSTENLDKNQILTQSFEVTSQNQVNISNLNMISLQRAAIKKNGLQQKHAINSLHHQSLNDKHLRSSDIYLSHSSYTTSDLDIEQLQENGTVSSGENHNIHGLILLEKTNHMRKDTNSTMSALQLPVAASISNLDHQPNQNKRRHSSNTGFKLEINNTGSSGAISSEVSQTSNVRRIKSTALDVGFPQPSVLNLTLHPNSTEAIVGQHFKSSNPPLLPPPSKCLVRNHHLIFCSNFGEHMENINLNIGSDSAACCKEYSTDYARNSEANVYPIAEQVEKINENDQHCLLVSSLSSNKYKDKNLLERTTERLNQESTDNNETIMSNKNNVDYYIDNQNEAHQESGVSHRSAKNDNNNHSYSHRSECDGCDNYINSSEVKQFTNTTESESEIEKPRAQSTDSETDNNGSRSPLLNQNINDICKSKLSDLEQPNFIQLDNKKFFKNAKRNKNFTCVQSPCTSCDQEEMNSNSKDMLLENEESFYRKSGYEVTKSGKSITSNDDSEMLRGLNIAQEEADIENLCLKDAKSLGAIPKTCLRRSSEIPIVSGMDVPVGGITGMNALPNKRSASKPMSRTSSSASSRSFSAESFTNDAYRTYKDRYSFIFGQDVSQQSSMLHPLHQNGLCGSVYQTALTRRNLNENLGNFRLKHRVNIVDSDNIANTACVGSGKDTLGSNNTSKLDDSLNFARNNMQQQHEASASLSIQGLINEQYPFENSLASGAVDQHHSRHRNLLQPSTGAMLNVEINDSIYCDYWRSCRLSTEKPIHPKKFYKYRWKFLGRRELKITMDRLQLLALFDRDLNWFHVILAISLSSLTCFLGSYILQLGLYKDIFAFCFCIVIAGSQYSLLKSVQPDAASPIHGFNKTVSYSRPIYFCICSLLLVFSFQLQMELKEDVNTQNLNHLINKIEFFGVTFTLKHIIEGIINFLSNIILLFPIFFSLGLFPQVNTFSMYLLEQIDMHIFGGNAVCSLLSSVICIMKSLIAVGILYGPAFGGLSEEKGTQHLLFSFFCSLLISVAYHLSRSASDFSHIWALIKFSLANTLPDDEEESDNNEDAYKIISKKSLKNKSCVEENEKSNNELINGTLTKNAVVSSSGSDMHNGKYGNSSTDKNTETLKIAEIDNMAKLAKATCSIKSKLEINEDKVVNNVGEENELSTETIESSNALNGLDMEQSDPLPKKLQTTVNSRLKNDLVICTILVISMLSLHSSTVFTVLQPDLNIVLYTMAVILGFILHYVLPQMRKHMPWLCFASPLLKQKEFGQFEVSKAAKVMWFEAIYVCLCFLERNVLYPLIFISALTADSQHITRKYGISAGALIITICSLKCMRNAYSDPASQYLILIFSVLLFKLDFNYANETFVINFFVISILFKKSCDFFLKLQFIVTYIAPWQITWGSAFHAFAQPFSVPHSAMLFLQAGISSILSTPLNPFLGSAIFLTSYVRPIKFWERDYNTRRIDHSNTRLSSQLERDLGADDNNLNSIFYEHLTRSLQHSLCGDLLLGRWGNVNQGDCFVLASDYLNCLVHIVELGNGLCTFQMRGLEFRGTYCQQREVEAISEGVEDNDACCCCNPGHIPKMLSANAMFSTRWLAWQVVAAQYVLEGYSISENLATATLQPFEFRKVLITYYIKSIVYYVTKNSKLEKWLASGAIQDSLSSTLGRQFVDLDPIFNYNLDEDFDFRALGITRSSFCSTYLNWIQLCYKKRKDSSFSTNLPSTDIIPNSKNESESIRANNNSVEALKGKRFLKENQEDNKILDKNTINEKVKQETGEESEEIKRNSHNVYNNLKINDSHEGKFKKSEEFCETSNCDLLPDITDRGNSKNLYVSDLKSESPEKQPTALPTSRTAIRCRKKVHKRRLKFGTGVNTDPLKSVLHNNAKTEASELGNGISKESPLISLCFALSLLARRSLATASHSSLSGVDFFLHGLHALFKGDFRITSPRDEWSQ
ncbi:protein pecanex isoform X2 [Condylostylus longicornis]|uniref:protein pecanex isoform X2 n=1 Tax=Condylostylus longicornis TaxID=2530218 RepID=UPI00244DAC66|nr:protein pecanex isoform X2 [Condylostylus longicornis]